MSNVCIEVFLSSLGHIPHHGLIPAIMMISELHPNENEPNGA
jgi:hypothetical protein